MLFFQIYFVCQFKAGGFLASSNGHAVAQEVELTQNVYSNNSYTETASLLEQVYTNLICCYLDICLMRTVCQGSASYMLFLVQEINPGPSNQSGLRFISGIICKSKALRFERMLFRATRGNMLFNRAPADEEIVDPVTDEMVFFDLFILNYLLVKLYSECDIVPLYRSFWSMFI